MIKRVVVACVAVVCLGALGYAQGALEGSQPTNDPVNLGGTYEASFCADKTFMTSGVSGNFFLMRVTAVMNRGWLEADVASRLKPGTNTLDAPTPKMRINQAQLCFVHVAAAAK